MAWVYKRGATIYVGYKDEHGRKVQLAARNCRTLTEAKRYASELELKAERVRVGLDAPIAKDLSLSAGVEKYLASLPPEYASRKALEGRLRNRVLPHIGKRGIRTVTAADVRTVLAVNGDASVQTREHVRVAMQGAFRFFREAGLAERNPAAEVGKLPIPRTVPKYLAKNEIPRLMEEIPQQWRLPALVALGTAVRKGELLALRKSDVRLDDGVLEVARSHDRETTKGGKVRHVPIPVWLAPLLARQLREVKGALLFPNPQGKRWSRYVRLHDIMRRALGRAGLVTGYEAACKGRGPRKGCGFEEHREAKGAKRCPRCQNTLRIAPVAKDLRWKDLRSTWATHAAALTGDIRFVQVVLGHGDLNVTTNKYAHAIPAHLQSQMARVELPIDRAASWLQAKRDETKPKQAKRNQLTRRNGQRKQRDTNAD